MEKTPDTAIQILKEILAEDISTWIQVDNTSKECKIYKKEIDNQPPILHAHGFYPNIPKEMILNVIEDLDHRNKWDPMAS